MKNMKYTTKLLLTILSIAVISMAAIIAVSYVQMVDMWQFSKDINAQLGVTASESSEQALIKQAESYLSRLAISKSDKCNAIFWQIQRDVLNLAIFLQGVYQKPDSFLGWEIPTTEPHPHISAPTMFVTSGVEITSEIEKEMLLVSNVEKLFDAVLSYNPSYSIVYLGTETGINFVYTSDYHINPDFDPRTRQWYTETANFGGLYWSDTYISRGGYTYIYDDQRYHKSAHRGNGICLRT